MLDRWDAEAAEYSPVVPGADPPGGGGGGEAAGGGGGGGGRGE
jgi:hypothetical protein